VPIEWWEPWYTAVQVAVGNGMIVCEAAGNGYEDLDAQVYSKGNGGHYPFLLENDSGAILVGAGGAYNSCYGSTWRARLSFSNYGSRVDIQGWGECVMTTGYGDAWSEANCDFTSAFSGTSSATPIVSGACMLVQSYAETFQGEVLTPSALRTLLTDTGLPQANPSSGNIGPFPDAFAAINSLPAIGVCCVDSSCMLRNELDCISDGGDFLGDETTCDGMPCTLPIFIEYPSGLPETIDPYGGTSVQIHVADGSSSPVPDSGNLHVKASGPFWIEVPLVDEGNSDYVATFPYMEWDCGEPIDWFVSFDTVDGNVVVSPSNAPDTMWSAYVYSGQSTLFNDNFQSNMGWIPIASAEDGNWVRGVPSGSGSACDPPSDADGSGMCFVTGNGANEDVDGGSTMLYSPTIPVDMSEAPVLSYYRWYSNGSTCGGANTYEDVMLVDISTDGGNSFAPLEMIGPMGDDAEGGWRYVEFNLTEVLGDTGMIDLRLLFTCGDEEGPSIIEGGVDSVKVTNAYCDPPPACLAADIDSNGVVGVADLLAVIDQWGESGSADVNGDGTVNVGDLLAIVDAWGPCP